jgi:hypothetical protein
MKTLFLFLTALVCLSFTSEESEITISEYVLDQSVKDNTLEPAESVYKFTFKNISDGKSEKIITYSIDGVEGKESLINNSYLEIKTTPGNHKFQFYYNEDFMEVYTDSLVIKPQYRDDYSVNFSPALEFIMVDKPVIYLYPESETEVEVKLNIKGAETFTYPIYNQGWKFKAQPDGTLAFGEKTFNYLFWESKQTRTTSMSENLEGFVVKGTETIRFLEEKLTLAGLTSKEQADFITFWGPRLAQHETNFVHFEFNETCNKYAELEISPKPDQIYRIYMLWSPVETNHSCPEQKIILVKREGFTVLEWGGSQSNFNFSLITQEL